MKTIISSSKEEIDKQFHDDLRPCPFCGGEATVIEFPNSLWDKFAPVCENHKCVAFYIGYSDEGLYNTEEKAIEAWNTRTDVSETNVGKIRAKAIDEVAEKIKEHMQIVGTTYLEDIFEIAEQMKGGVSDDIH